MRSWRHLQQPNVQAEQEELKGAMCTRGLKTWAQAQAQADCPLPKAQLGAETPKLRAKTRVRVYAEAPKLRAMVRGEAGGLPLTVKVGEARRG